MMRRVRKEEMQPAVMPQRDGMAICLDCWRLWMGKDDRDLSASRMRFRTKEVEAIGYERDIDEEQRMADLRIGEATGVMIDDLKAHYRWAIYNMCGMTSLWQFPLLKWEEVALLAMDELEKKLRKNIVTATLF